MLSAMNIRYGWDKLVERFWFTLAWGVPRRLAYFCTIRLGAHATTGDYGHQVVPDLTYMDALKRW